MADIVRLQEVRARSEQPPPAVRDPAAWHLYAHAGDRTVALFSRCEPDGLEIETGEPDVDAGGVEVEAGVLR